MLRRGLRRRSEQSLRRCAVCLAARRRSRPRQAPPIEGGIRWNSQTRQPGTDQDVIASRGTSSHVMGVRSCQHLLQSVLRNFATGRDDDGTEISISIQILNRHVRPREPCAAAVTGLKPSRDRASAPLQPSRTSNKTAREAVRKRKRDSKAYTLNSRGARSILATLQEAHVCPRGLLEACAHV